MVVFINVRLIKVERDCYILRAEDDSSDYEVPISAFDLKDGLIIPVAEDTFLKLNLLGTGQATARATDTPEKENNCSGSPSNGLPKISPLITPTSTKKKWLSAPVKNLLFHYGEHRPQFSSTSIRAEEVWKKIHEKMAGDGFHFTSEQIKTKFSKLKQQYMKVKDNNLQTGVAPMDFQWLEEFDAIFAKNHNVEPVATASSLTFTPLAAKPTSSTSVIPKHSKKINTEKIIENIEKMRQERANRQHERNEERSIERREILNELRRGNDLFEKVLEKFAEKK
ncbi:unnamed protein product [Ceutorhynchus assimilis]|uniref:Myb/SANT-like DNA-binding domain-containing protein n=1 Tax=Ceutorhynchus assimilis TaxID=467358 RepID=A0A9N9M9R3_9CUCU|nr:unnamed protein product [Ceutorhynchus assimilis]